MRCVLQPPPRCGLMQRAVHTWPQTSLRECSGPCLAEGSRTHGRGKWGMCMWGELGQGTGMGEWWPRTKSKSSGRWQDNLELRLQVPEAWAIVPLHLLQYTFIVKLRNLRWQPQNIKPQSGALVSTRTSVTGHLSMTLALPWTFVSCQHDLVM